MTLSRVFDFPRMLGCATSLLPLPVLRERAGVRVISSTNGHRNSKSPSPQPSPGVPGEGAEQARAIVGHNGASSAAFFRGSVRARRNASLVTSSLWDAAKSKMKITAKPHYFGAAEIRRALQIMHGRNGHSPGAMVETRSSK
jgi:hypothetical protein